MSSVPKPSVDQIIAHAFHPVSYRYHTPAIQEELARRMKAAQPLRAVRQYERKTAATGFTTITEVDKKVMAALPGQRSDIEAVGLSRSAVGYSLAKLCHLGLIAGTGHKNRPIYHATGLTIDGALSAANKTARIPVKHRREKVIELRAAGMTIPAIARKLNVSISAVKRDLKHALDR